jgi:NADH dehydrogenase
LVGILNERGDSGAGFDKVYVELTEALIAACHKVGIQRLLQMSALNAGRGRSNYLRARGEAEAEIKGSGLKWTLFQPSVIFGPGDGLYFRFAQLLAIMPVLPLARADAKFAPVYVGDVAEAFARTLLDDASIGQTYELYGPQVMTLAEIVRYTAKQRGMARLVLPLPDALGRLQALASEFIPGKPFSRDNFRSLLTPSVGGIDGLYRLGIERTPVDAVMPALLRRDGRQVPLDRYRRYAAR